MADEWNAITIDGLDVDKRLIGIEPGAKTLDAIEPHLEAAKGDFRRKARAAFDDIYVTHAISDTALFDQVAALPATGATRDLNEDLRHGLRLETLAGYYKNSGGKAGA